MFVQAGSEQAHSLTRCFLFSASGTISPSVGLLLPDRVNPGKGKPRKPNEEKRAGSDVIDVVSLLCRFRASLGRERVVGYHPRTGGNLQDSPGDDRVRRCVVGGFQEIAELTFRGPVPHNRVTFFSSGVGRLPPNTQYALISSTQPCCLSSVATLATSLPFPKREFCGGSCPALAVCCLCVEFINPRSPPPFFSIHILGVKSHDRQVASRGQGLATRCLDLDCVLPYKAGKEEKHQLLNELIKRQHPRAICDANVHKHRRLCTCDKFAVKVTSDACLIERSPAGRLVQAAGVCNDGSGQPRMAYQLHAGVCRRLNSRAGCVQRGWFGRTGDRSGILNHLVSACGDSRALRACALLRYVFSSCFFPLLFCFILDIIITKPRLTLDNQLLSNMSVNIRYPPALPSVSSPPDRY